MSKNLLSLKRRSVLSSRSWLFVLLFSSISILNAQDVLLGQYDFISGVNQEKPSLVTSGLTFSDIIFEPGGLTVTYNDNNVVTASWPSALDISTGKSVQFTIAKSDFLSEFNVSKILLYYKAATEKHRIDAYFGSTVNPTNLASKRTGQTAVDFKMIDMDEGRNSNGVLFPAVTDNAPLYFAVGFTQATETSEVTFERIEVWGTATAAPSAVTVDVLSKVVNASVGNPFIFPVKVSGLTATQDISLSIVGTDAGHFSIDKSSITAAELNAGDQIVTVTYNATANTYNLESNAHIPHNASLRIQSSEVPTIDVLVYASCHVLFEDFVAYDGVVPTNEPGVPSVVGDFPTIPGNEILTAVPGWTGDFLYAYVTGKTFGSINMVSSASDSAYLISPATDLSKPFKLTVSFRSFNNQSDGRFFIHMDDLLIFTDVNKTNSIKTVTTDTYIGSTNSKIKFTGLKDEFNQIIVDDIIVNYSSQAPVNGTGLMNIPDGSIKVRPDGVELNGFQGKSVSVYAISGIRIHERSQVADQEFISLSNKGCYILKIYDGNNQVAKKIIIQ